MSFPKHSPILELIVSFHQAPEGAHFFSKHPENMASLLSIRPR